MNILINGTQFEMSSKAIERFHSRYIKTDSCWLSQGSLTNKGYIRLGLSLKGKGVKRGMHQVSYALYNGPIYEGELVRHTCNNRICCNPEHLLKGDTLDNMKDRLAHQVAQIRQLIADGEEDNEAIVRKVFFRLSS